MGCTINALAYFAGVRDRTGYDANEERSYWAPDQMIADLRRWSAAASRC